jgi:hypothetical protein
VNSSLLVPGLIVVAVTAGVFVFGDSLFSGGSSDEVSTYSVTQPNTTDAADASAVSGVAVDVADATVSTGGGLGSDFSWDEEPTESPRSPLAKPSESFVSSKQTEEAPGALYGSENGQQASGSSPSAGQVTPADDFSDEFAASDLGVRNDASAVEDLVTSLESQTQPAQTQPAPGQVEDDLSSFFNLPPKTKATDAQPALARSSASTAPPSATKLNVDTVDPLDTAVAVASPKADAPSLDNFGEAYAGATDFAPAQRTKVDDEMKSVVSTKPRKSAETKYEAVPDSSDAGGVISGALEPVKDKKKAQSIVRKFKITNPKETTLPVTLSVDGKQLTLKPDQSYVIQESDGDVEVTFSRGGSFGFQTKSIKEGHYRFTVSREAGWKLIN